MIPIVFSHGLTASRSLYTTHCRELAACGYIVFALDHHDGSCHYTEDAEGNSIHFDTGPPERVFDGNFNEVYVKIELRQSEAIELIDELYQKNFVDEVLGFTDGATLDLNKLVMAGHSMGGATAIRVGEADPRVKCVLTFDPWLLALSKEILGKRLKGLNKDQAFLLLNSDTFHSWGVTLDHRGCYE